MKKLTALDNPNSVQQMKQWLSDNGLEVDSLGKKEVAEMLKTAPAELQKVLLLRQQLAKSSVKKYQAMEDQVIDQMILQWKMEYLQSQREWLFTLLGGKMEDSYVQQMSEMWKETDGSGEH